MREQLSVYEQAEATIFGISVDSLYTLRRFKEELQLNFDLLSDFNREVSAAYGVLYDFFPGSEMKGVSKRAAFVIDKDGLVKYAEVCASPEELPHFDAIERTLKNCKN